IILALYQVIINPLRYVVGVSGDAITYMTTYITENASNLGIEFTSQRGTIGLINLINQQNGVGFLEGVKDFVKPESLSKITLTGQQVYDEFVNALNGGLPDFNFLGLNLAETPGFTPPTWLLVIPVLTFAVYFASMKINRKFSYQPATGNDPATDKATGCSNNMMDIMMPAFSVYICFIVPAAIGVYWMFKSIIGTLRQILLFKLMPLPTFTEEEYKAAEREYAGKAPKKQRAPLNIDGTKGNPASIFHQDDEDYVPEEESAEIAKKLESADPGQSGIVETAPIKEDDRKKKDEK
ncbi:MAG: YidC/Oxa1 family membrane protein insertase, partial [Clostridia bacterium]|nr:YidC/Oxa1 family membrane protein insertase [Clostridia bacterium]